MESVVKTVPHDLVTLLLARLSRGAARQIVVAGVKTRWSVPPRVWNFNFQTRKYFIQKSNLCTDESRFSWQAFLLSRSVRVWWNVPISDEISGTSVSVQVFPDAQPCWQSVAFFHRSAAPCHVSCPWNASTAAGLNKWGGVLSENTAPHVPWYAAYVKSHERKKNCKWLLFWHVTLE